MNTKINIGDKVTWNTAKGETEGEVVEIITSSNEASKYHVTASKDDPKYKVKSFKTGKTALHNREALHKG
jgi:hypothetical protein